MISLQATPNFCNSNRKTGRIFIKHHWNTAGVQDFNHYTSGGYRRSKRQLSGTCCSTGFGDSTSKNSIEKDNKKTGKSLATELKSINVVLLGDNTEINFALASVLAPVIEYTPLHTSSILQQFNKKPVQKIIEEDGEEELGLSEALVLESLSDHVRCVISTHGGGIGAAARAACWRYLFGALTIWIHIEDEDKGGPQDEAYAQCDIHLKIKANNEEHSSVLSEDSASIGKALLPHLLSVMKKKLEEDDGLCKKKGLYVRLGSRGDWPNIEPPEWSPENSNL